MSSHKVAEAKMVIKASIISVVLLAAAAATICVTRSVSAAEPSADAKMGHDIYMRDGCWQCHGTAGQGGGPFGPKLIPALPFEAFRQQLRHPVSEMPVYTAKVMSDQDLAAVYAYVKSLPPAKPLSEIPMLNLK
jgi:mono/diheme cytochrome c family protein